MSSPIDSYAPAADTRAVTVDVAAPRQRAYPLGLARVAALPARYALAGLVALSFAVRWVLAAAHVTPYYFPDEYIYPALARGIADSGWPAIRDAPARFPALLEPLLAAPFWLPGEPVAAYELTQGLHALAMSLAAIPAYLLARRLGLGTWFALGAAALAVSGPNLMYASFMLADPIAYPLALAAICAGVCALSRPTARAQLAFVAFSGLATFARAQYVLLPAAFLGAALIVERGSVRRVVRNLRLSLALLATPLLVLAALGPARILGPYVGLADERIRPGDLLHWAATDAMLLAYSAGWVLVPGALLGLAYALVRPASRAESAFAALTILLAAGLFAEAALIAGIDSRRFQERYLFALLPLVAPAFGLYVKRGWPRRLAVALVAVCLLAVSARVPLSGYTASHNKDDSPTLRAIMQLEERIGTANGSLAVAALAALLSLVAIAIACRRRRGALVALVLSLAATGTLSAGAFAFDLGNARSVRAAYLPADARWVDHAGLENVALLQLPGAHPARAFEQLVWNLSVNRLLLLDSPKIDAFSAHRVRVSDDGRLLVGGEASRRPLLVQTYGSHAAFTGVTPVARTDTFELLRPVGTPRLSLLAAGLYADGWLARSASVSVWPDADGRTQGTLRIVLWMPRGTQRTPLRLSAAGLDLRLAIAPGERRVLELPVTACGPWTVFLTTSRPGYLGDARMVSVAAEPPTFARDRSGLGSCGTTRSL